MIPGNANPLLLASAAADAAAAGPIKSLRFNQDDSANLSRSVSSSSNRRTWTFACWLKKSELYSSGGYQNVFASGNTGVIQFDTIDQLRVYDGQSGGATIEADNIRMRDVSAWYHIVVKYDTTQATATDRVFIYINGVDATKKSATFPTQNYESAFNLNQSHYIGTSSASSNYLAGYLADIYFIDGSALEPTSFGAFDDSGVWQAAAYSGTFGTNGFHLLDFENESTVGHDSSGNENDFTANNISTTAGAGNDVLFDVPTNGDQSDTGAGGEVSGNYATLNPLNIHQSSNDTISNGNLECSMAGGSAGLQPSTIAISSGKFYYEVVFSSNASNSVAGIRATNSRNFDDTRLYHGSGQKWRDGSADDNYGASFTEGDVIGVAIDKDNNLLSFYKNGSSQGTSHSLSSFDSVTTIQGMVAGTTGGYTVNFGQRAFAYSAPSGFKALCTTNLPTPTIADGSDYFDIDTYSGTGASHERSNFSFNPDWLWFKSRNTAAFHTLIDSVRGGGNFLRSNTTSSETTGQTDLVTSFDSDGFTMGANAVSGDINQSGRTYVCWAWDASSSTVSNTDGDITTSLRANATAGFSLATYSGSGTNGDTIGHGLGVEPDFCIVKARNKSDDWRIYHSALGTSKILALNSSNAASSASNWQSISSTTLGLQNDAAINGSGYNYVAYFFAAVAGYSQISSWEGNGSTDGPFVHTGFRPAFILYKASDAAEHWHIRDTAREPFNVTQNRLLPSSTIAEGGDSDFNIDILSNGFKLRASNATQNQSGTTYVYYAVAENPFSSNGGLAR